MQNHSSNNSFKPSSPLQVNERLELIDILRAFALIGIFIVNIQFYVAKPNDTIDIISWLIKIFFEGSFYPLFSILFGISFVILLNRTEVNGKPNLRLFVRRLFILAIIASLQFIFLEPRHILFRYTLLGIPLITFYSSSKKVLMWSIAMFFIISIFHNQIVYSLDKLRRHSAEAKNVFQLEVTEDDLKQETIKMEKNNLTEYSDYVINNSKQLIPQVINLTRHSSMPHIFASFLFGIFIWRWEIFQRLHEFRPFLLSWLIFCGLFGLIGNIGAIILEWSGLAKAHPLETSILQTIGDSLLAVCYISGIALASLSAFWSKLIKLLIPAGRMGLTNYLLQSVIMSFVFLNYGLNLKDKLSVLECLVIVIMSTVVQIILSTWWFQRFKYGPVEWVWRLLTYGRWLSIRNR